MTDTKVALVTGASKGIGRAIAIALAKEGYKVAINYKSDTTAAEEVLRACEEYGAGHLLLKADVSEEAAVKAMVEQFSAQFDHVDVVVNNAGIFDERDHFTDLEAFDNTYRNNLLSCVLVTKYVRPLMTSGSILNMSSVHGQLGYGRPESIAYSAFKAALNSYTKNMAKELAPEIRVNAIAPGRVATSMWGIESEVEKAELGKAHLIKRMIEPEEVADAALFLLKNRAMCGEILTIDGGYTLAKFLK
jgi:3-oxoacyl-[acyl-carrier protein] reductase